MEPTAGEATIPGDLDLLGELRNFNSDAKANNDVVGTNFRDASPSYEPLSVLRDAILRNTSMGDDYGLEVFKGEVYQQPDANGEVDLAAFFEELSMNTSVADPLTGETWAERVCSNGSPCQRFNGAPTP